MWILLYDCFFSIVKKDCADDELLVRARRPGDIEKIWKDAKVVKALDADYLFRAVIKKDAVISAISTELTDIDYGNFKNNVKDNALHNAYLSIWTVLSKLQPTPPYSKVFKTRKKR